MKQRPLVYLSLSIILLYLVTQSVGFHASATLIIDGEDEGFEMDFADFEWVLDDDNSTSNTKTPSPTTTSIIASSLPSDDNGKTFFINRCISQSGKCCLSGYIGIDSKSSIFYTLRGTTPSCGNNLQKGIVGRRVATFSQKTKQTDGFSLNVNDVGNIEKVSIQVNDAGDKLIVTSIVASGSSSSPFISTAWASWRLSFKQGVDELLLPNPDATTSDPSDDDDGAEIPDSTTSNNDKKISTTIALSIAIPVALILVLSLYVCIPMIRNKRLHGRYEHPHAEYVKCICNKSLSSIDTGRTRKATAESQSSLSTQSSDPKVIKLERNKGKGNQKEDIESVLVPGSQAPKVSTTRRRSSFEHKQLVIMNPIQSVTFGANNTNQN